MQNKIIKGCINNNIWIIIQKQQKQQIQVKRQIKKFYYFKVQMNQDPTHPKDMSNGRYKNAIEMDDIQLEQIDQPDLRNQKRGSPIGDGKANRIGQYRKTGSEFLPEKSPTGSSPRFVGKKNLTEVDLNSYSSSPFFIPSHTEDDMKQAVINMYETQEVNAEIKEFEKCFCGAKTQINDCDLVNLETEIAVQALKMQYKILHGLIYEENPNFDVEKMQHNIENILAKVKNSNQGYNRFKGEFFAVSEPVINKDILVFKLEMVQRYHERQTVLMKELPDQVAGLQDNFENLQQIKKKYEVFEMQIFKNKFQETSYVIKDTTQCIQKIELQQVQIQDSLDKAKIDLAVLIPQNKEQRLRLSQINGEIQSIQKRLETSLKVISQAKVEQEQLEIKNKNNSVSLKNMKPVDMLQDITQTRELEKFVQNHNDWLNLYKKLKMLNDEKISTANFDLQNCLQDSKKYIDGVINGRQDEYDDLLKQIQKVAKKISDDIIEQNGRLSAFEAHMITPNDGRDSVIADYDLLFLKKEVSRIKYTLQCAQASNDQYVTDSQEMNNKKLKNGTIEVGNLQQMRQNLIALQKIDAVDIERIARNIDLLEGFTIKNLKNTLNEDNKKSQIQISKMKKNYEDLQKYIDALNAKLFKVSGDVVRLKENFTNDDLERINEIFNKCDDKLNDCDMNINGDKSQTDQDPTKIATLQARKKDVIALINKMVNVFNENNKLIKESNKGQKTEKEISDLIKNNNEIQEDCKKIEDKVSSAKEFAAEIDLVLDSILEPAIGEIMEKYLYKNQKIDECDELFDTANAQIDKLGNILAQQQAKLKEIISKLDTVNPMINPTTQDKVDNGFLADVQKKIDAAYKLQDDLESMKENLGATRDTLIDVVQPLNELDEREVKQPEIDHILNALGKINTSLMVQVKEIMPKNQEIGELEIELMNMLDKNKGNKINEAVDKLKLLIISVNDLGKNKDHALDRLTQFKDALQDAKRASKNDPALAQKIREMEGDARGIEKEISDIDTKIVDLKRSSTDQEKLLNDIKANPQKFKPAEIESLLTTLDELLDKAEQINDKLRNKLIPNQDEMFRLLNNLVGMSQQKYDLLQKIDAMDQDIQENLLKYKEHIDKLPGGVELMIGTLQECLLDSTPDKTADYYKEKDQITGGLKDLKAIKDNLEKIDRTFQKKKADVDTTIQSINRGSSDIPELIRISESLKTNHLELEALLNDTFDQQDEFKRIQKDHGDFTIGMNIRLRQNDLKAQSERLDKIYEEFAELKQADNDFESEQSVEERIRKQIQKIDLCIKNAERDRKENIKLQKTLERYTVKDFQNCSGNHLIIKQVREFRFQIIEQNKNLVEIERMITDLNSELIQQDMDNAIKILAKKSLKLRQRLQEAMDDLTQIKNCGEEMDGNTTINEEDEFIDALKDEMPEVFKNIEYNFEQLDAIEVLIKEVLKTKNTEKMQLIKKEVDDASNKVEQSEGLVLKLENEIIEWNALRKLCTRDEELFEIDTLLKEFEMDLKDEQDVMQKEIQFNQTKNEKEGDPKGELEAMKNGIISYQTEIDELMKQVLILSKERSSCYNEFDQDVPAAVKQERLHRLQQNAQQEGKKYKIDFNLESDKPSDIYYMITINCRYKSRIHSLLKELRNINQSRRELDDKYALLKKDLSAMKLVKTYKAVKGDAIDELFAVHMNKVSLNLPVKRLGEGKYLFGTKQILAKIINGKLVIRVGGGYMSADEFIEQYGRIEILKIMKAQGEIDNSEMLSRGSIHRDKSNERNQNNVGMGDMKKMLRDSMFQNTNVYGQLDTREHAANDKRNTVRLDNSRDRSDGKGLRKKASLQSPKPVRNTRMAGSNSNIALNGLSQTKKGPSPLLQNTAKKGTL